MLVDLFNWFNDRTGHRKFVSVMLIEDIPGGAKWRYVWGSCLAFVFAVQLITGVILMTAYSPGDSTAWGSVYFIQYKMDFGWLIRGLHHFGSQTMVVLLGLHMLQVVIAVAHLPPREINWWLGLALLGAVLGLSLTGYLLPWDQKGYWATQVATKIAGNLPGMGRFVERIAVGGPEYGHHTLTRFYALHVAVLPALVILLTTLHIMVFRRHGVTHPKDAEGTGWFWPDQAFKDLLACLFIFGIMLALVMRGDSHKLETTSVSESQEASFYDKWAKAGRDGFGANLDAPADPSKAYPARPEWYFLSLFQLLKYFEGSQEIIGTVIIPNGIFVLLAVLPLVAFGRQRGGLRSLAHALGVILVVGILCGAATLTCLAVADDTVAPTPREVIKLIGTKLIPLAAGVLFLLVGAMAAMSKGPFKSLVYGIGTLVLVILLGGAGYLFWLATSDPTKLPPRVTNYVESKMTADQKKPTDNATKIQDELDKAGKQADRAIQLANDGIPVEGAVLLLRRDPMTRGRELFEMNCASCHSFGTEFKRDKFTASNLQGFGTEDWIFRLLVNPGHNDYFGLTRRSGMQTFIEETFPNVNLKPDEVAKLPPDEQATREKDLGDLRTIARWLAGHPRRNCPDRDSAEFQNGLKTFKARQCAGCHSYEGAGGTRKGNGPDLTGYGDNEWLQLMLLSPHHPKRYGLSNAMPLFPDADRTGSLAASEDLDQLRTLYKQSGKKEEETKKEEEIKAATKVVPLSEVERELVIRFIMNDSRTVFGGEPTSGAVK